MQVAFLLRRIVFYEIYFGFTSSCYVNECERMERIDTEQQQGCSQPEYTDYLNTQLNLDVFLNGVDVLGYLGEEEVLLTCLVVSYDDFLKNCFEYLKDFNKVESITNQRFLFLNWILCVISKIDEKQRNDCFFEHLNDFEIENIIKQYFTVFPDFSLLIQKLFLLKNFGTSIILEPMLENKLAIFLLQKFEEVIFNKNSKIHGFLPEALASIEFFREETKKIDKMTQETLKSLVFILKFMDATLRAYEYLHNKLFFFCEISFVLRFLFEEMCQLMGCYKAYKKKLVCLLIFQLEEKQEVKNYTKYIKSNIIFFFGL